MNYIFVGLNKCGGTTIRYIIRKDKLAIYYPGRKITKLFNKNLKNREEKIKQIRQDLLSKKKSGKITYINCGQTISPNIKLISIEDRLKILKKIDKNFKIIAIFRKEESWIISFYKELFADGNYSMLFEEYLLKYKDQFFGKNRSLNNNKVKNLIKKKFPKNYKFYNFESFIRDNENFVFNYLKYLKVNKPFSKIKYKNKSLSDLSIKLTIYLNKYIKLKNKVPQSNHSEFLNKLINRIKVIFCPFKYWSTFLKLVVEKNINLHFFNNNDYYNKKIRK